MKQIIHTALAPPAIGPYVQAVKVKDWLYISGCIPITADTGNMVAGAIEEQTHQALKNLEAILTAAGGCKKDIVKTTCFLTDIERFNSFNRIYADYFENEYPARSCVEVSRLPKDALVEIEAVAYLGRA
ncbi:RidA family protein [Testudinibacter sp. TR-2022]|uniref:RidA family protein n=1 Tax=Testudinibacter sp. TR-2022 TaxID=2585029 RepID=UPI00111885C6|nr:RidA family protein [Testudinibacter sp. TR-2022]TNH03277.1 RidA family protein [Pasteurellaceae bacterium Phil31]TNH10944.1 RidA family protein [Testudinibacter sp. TR-2022]TNH12311.1 RidA family protein [Testudinibacter sp. TR-2022]TNH13389.1 RidA family protein [Testudinibacter sp. TR-2022]TNH20524.1 RidA family protein [Testudinibacter sp. TR-2022]